MKENKAFTLVELMAVITLLAAIVLISVPTIINTLKRSEETGNKDFNDAIIRAAELYVEMNRDLYPELETIGNSIEIDTDTLIEENYLKQDLVNPNDNSNVNTYKVQITVGNDEIFEFEVLKKNS